MGGGTSIWASPEWKKDPKEIFNGRLWFLLAAVAFAGCSYGFDQGNIGGVLTLPSFRHAFGLDELSEEEQNAREGNIAAMSKFYLVFMRASTSCNSFADASHSQSLLVVQLVPLLRVPALTTSVERSP